MVVTIRRAAKKNQQKLAGEVKYVLGMEFMLMVVVNGTALSSVVLYQASSGFSKAIFLLIPHLTIKPHSKVLLHVL